MLRSVAGSVTLDGGDDSPSVSRLARLKRDSLGSPRQSITGSNRQDISEILAQQNVISERFFKHDIFFERSKIQTGEIQTQLSEQQEQLSDVQNQLGVLQDQYDAIQRQQERIIDLLERLSSGKANEGVDPDITERLTAAVNGTPFLPTLAPPTLAAPASSNLTFVQEAHPGQSTTAAPASSKQSALVDDLYKKTPRPRGRPRKLCKLCKREKPLQPSTPYCEDCLDPLGQQVGSNRRSLATKDPEEYDRIKSPKRPRLEHAQNSRTKIPSSTLPDSAEQSGVPATQFVPHSAHTEPAADTPIRVGQPENSANLPESSETGNTRTPPSSERPEAWKDPVIKKWSAEIPPEASGITNSQLTLPPRNHPFLEGSAEQTLNYEDIVDPESMNETSTSSTRSVSAATSVAESLPIDEILDAINKNGQRVPANASRRNSSGIRLSPPRPMRGQTKEARDRPIVIPTGRAPKANMVPKARRPEPAPSPEGKAKQGHEVLVEKIMGPRWQAVNRRF